jgi:hypothetical protein
LTQSKSVSGVQPIIGAIDSIAAHDRGVRDGIPA